MTISYDKVGIAPGTTTLTFGSHRRQAQQDPGVIVRNAYGQLMGPGAYFDARPTDFDLSKIYGYLPVHRGWISGKLSGTGLGSCCSGCAVGAPCGSLGEETAVESQGAGLTPAQQSQMAKFVLQQIATEDKALELKERRSRMFWGAIAGLAAATTAAMGVITYARSR